MVIVGYTGPAVLAVLILILGILLGVAAIAAFVWIAGGLV